MSQVTIQFLRLNQIGGNPMIFVSNVILKNKALEIAINTIELFKEDCIQGNCDLESPNQYHWKGCKHNLQPIIDVLKQALNQ
jgi:hypothetical protein